MGQYDILLYLCKNKRKWYYASDIAEEMEYAKENVLKNLKKLRECNDVEFKICSGNGKRCLNVREKNHNMYMNKYKFVTKDF